MTTASPSDERWMSRRGRDEHGHWADLTVDGVDQRLRWIPSGRFLMGSPEHERGRRDNEGPQRQVTLTRGYWLGDTPVTQALWTVVMGTNPSAFPSPQRPVERVDWFQAMRFCRVLDGMVDRGPSTVGMFRLPTDAEWEHACRAGTSTATWRGPLTILGACNAPGLDDIAWYNGNSGVGYDHHRYYDTSGWEEPQYAHDRAGTRIVKQKLPNPWGLYDMLGNVMEWCMDGNHRFTGEPVTDPCVVTGAARLFRGGSWACNARLVRAAFRGWYDPTHTIFDRGFRVALGGAVPEAMDQLAATASTS